MLHELKQGVPSDWQAANARGASMLNCKCDMCAALIRIGVCRKASDSRPSSSVGLGHNIILIDDASANALSYVAGVMQ